MFEPHRYESRTFTAAVRAMRRAHIADGLLGEEVDFPCALQVGDGLTVQRHGIPHGAASYIGVQAVAGPNSAMIGLTAAQARRLAAKLADMADEIDPHDPAEYDIDPADFA